MKISMRFLVGGLFAIAVAVATASSSNASFLFNTGLGNVGTSDLNYTVSPPNAQAIVIANNPNWLANDGTSKWISAVVNGGINDVAGGTYTFSTIFDLTPFVPGSVSITGRWLSDNAASLNLNGGSQLSSRPQANFTDWTSFTISSGFLAASNTLNFVVFNGLGNIPQNSPMGLRVEFTQLSTVAVPLPAAALLFVTGLPCLGLVLRRKKK